MNDKHCWHERVRYGVPDVYVCCWCGAGKWRTEPKPGHGPHETCAVDITDEPCPKRPASSTVGDSA